MLLRSLLYKTHPSLLLSWLQLDVSCRPASMANDSFGLAEIISYFYM